MKINKIAITVMILICCALIAPNKIFATNDSALNNIIDGMSGVGNVNQADLEGSSVRNVINAVIRLIQVAGTGISVLVVTMLGVKYMLASSGEKADIKKMAMPIVIGCVLLFAASNLVAIIAGIGTDISNAG